MHDKNELEVLKRGVAYWNSWRGKKLRHVDLSNLDLRNLDLTGINFRKVILRGTNLSGTVLHNADLNQLDFHETFLQGVDLSSADLAGANFYKVDLQNINLKKARLHYADLRSANLMGANLKGADLLGANLQNTILSDANLQKANLTGAILINTDLRRANLCECRIYGISVWNAELSEAEQSNLIITRPNEPEITVDNIEVAQFVYLLLNNQKIRNVIDTIAKKVVLILGRFSPERKIILDTIRDRLRYHDFLPIMFDFDKPTTRDLSETVRTLAHLSRFIIADISDPSSIPLELQTIIPDLAVPVQPLLLTGQREFSMFVDLRKKYHWVLPTCIYENLDHLLSSFETSVITPAETKAKELDKRS